MPLSVHSMCWPWQSPLHISFSQPLAPGTGEDLLSHPSAGELRAHTQPHDLPERRPKDLETVPACQ